MAKVLIIAEHADGQINPSVAKCVACAATIPDAEIDVAIFSSDGEALASQIAELASVSRVLSSDFDMLSRPGGCAVPGTATRGLPCWPGRRRAR